MTYKEKVIKDYGIDLTLITCPNIIFEGGYDCFTDINESLPCENCWEREYNNEPYSSTIIVKNERTNHEKN